MAAKSITFNSFSLQDTNFLTKDIIYRNLPSRSIDIEPYSRRDGFRLVDSYYLLKDISVSGMLSNDTEANLKTSLDNMKKALNIEEANLDIGDGATTIRYVCTLASLDIPEEHYNITNLPYKIVFRCEPFGQATSTTTLTRSITGSPASAFSTIGSAPPSPVFKWVCNGAPSAPITQISLRIYNTGGTPADMTITVPSVALDASGDYLEIDITLMTVKVSHDGGAAVEID